LLYAILQWFRLKYPSLKSGGFWKIFPSVSIKIEAESAIVLKVMFVVLKIPSEIRD